MSQVGSVIGSFHLLLCCSGLNFNGRNYPPLQEQTEATLEARSAADQAQPRMPCYRRNRFSCATRSTTAG